MYICKAEGKTTKQLELGDFFGKSRQIIFDMADPKDLKKANRVLKPKGVKPKKKRTSSKKTPSKVQKALETKIPTASANKSKISKKKTSSVEKRSTEVIERDSIKLDPVHSEPIPSEPILSTPILSEAIISEKTQEDKREKKQNKKNVPTVLQPQTGSISSPNQPKSDTDPGPKILLNSPKQPSSIVKPKPQPEVESKPISPPKSPKITGWEQILPSFLSDSVGDGGQLEVECPICHNLLAFHYEDLDVKNMKNTRYCDCGALVRISIRKSPAMIFLDLKIQKDALAILLKAGESEVMDEYNNPIFVYALKNE